MTNYNQHMSSRLPQRGLRTFSRNLGEDQDKQRKSAEYSQEEADLSFFQFYWRPRRDLNPCYRRESKEL